MVGAELIARGVLAFGHAVGCGHEQVAGVEFDTAFFITDIRKGAYDRSIRFKLDDGTLSDNYRRHVARVRVAQFLCIVVIH